MQRRPLVAAVLVNAVGGATLAGQATTALASSSDSEHMPEHGGLKSTNRGWDHHEGGGHTATS